jgi:hypothetical protein
MSNLNIPVETYRLEWDELPVDGQPFYLFAENTGFVRRGDMMVEKATQVAYPLVETGAWYPLPPDPPADPFEYWCSLWVPVYHNPHDKDKIVLWWGIEGKYRWYPVRDDRDTLNGNLLDRHAAPENRTIGNFDTLKAAQKAAYDHFMSNAQNP